VQKIKHRVAPGGARIIGWEVNAVIYRPIQDLAWDRITLDIPGRGGLHVTSATESTGEE
jgi:hypothetical protein